MLCLSSECMCKTLHHPFHINEHCSCKHELIIYTLISDDSPYYCLNGIRPSCNLLPNLQSSDAINLEYCIEIGKYGDGRDAVFLFRVLNKMKRGTVKVVIVGVGIDCSAANGFVLMAISSTGSSIPCKALLGNAFGKITCKYFCNCSSGCIMFRVKITDPMDKIICGFEVWI